KNWTSAVWHRLWRRRSECRHGVHLSAIRSRETLDAQRNVIHDRRSCAAAPVFRIGVHGGVGTFIVARAVENQEPASANVLGWVATIRLLRHAEEANAHAVAGARDRTVAGIDVEFADVLTPRNIVSKLQAAAVGHRRTGR